jgi:hypothetical protein
VVPFLAATDILGLKVSRFSGFRPATEIPALPMSPQPRQLVLPQDRMPTSGTLESAAVLRSARESLAAIAGNHAPPDATTILG